MSDFNTKTDFNGTLAAAVSQRLKAHKALVMCLAMGTAGSFGNVALAQPGAAPASNAGQLEEIIVTAERRTVDVQKTAVTMSVRSGDDLAAQGKTAVSQMLEDVPNVVVAEATIGNATGVSDSPSSRIKIRGVGSNGSPPASPVSMVPAVAQYVDGIYNGIGDTYDINRVEVLRGPQGTLYGRSATGGVVAIHTTDPVVGEFNGTAAAEFGDYNLRHYNAGLNVPVGSVAALRFSGSDYARDGYYAKEGAAQHTTDGRVKLLLTPTDNLSILAGMALRNNVGRTGELGGVMNSAGLIEYTQALPLGTGRDETRQYWAQIDWDLGPATLTYLPALRNWTMYGTVYNSPAPGATLTNLQKTPYDQFHTEELRLSSNEGSLIKWQTGAFYFDNDLRSSINLVVSGPFFPPGGILLQDSVTSHSTTNTGVFAEATFPLTDKINLTAGLRYDRTKVVTETTNTTGLGGGNTIVLPASEGTRNWNNTTYKLRLEDNLTDNSLLYASVSSAFLPGNVAVSTGPTGSLAISPYEPETLTAFEVGSKNRFFDETFQVNAALFYYRYGGYQQSVRTGSLPGGIFLFDTANSPARMVGGELELLFQPTRSDRFGLNVSVLNPYYKDKPALFAVGVAQSKIPGITTLTINPSYSHIFEFGNSQSITVQLDALYNGDYDVFAIPASVAAQGGADYIGSGAQTVGNVSASWAFTPKSSLTVWARNVTDERFNTYANISSITPVVERRWYLA